MNRAITFIHSFLRWAASFSVRRAPLVVVVSLALTGLAAWFATGHLVIHTDTDEMIDSSLPFRQTFDDFNRAFPQFLNSFTAVIDAPSPEAAEQAQGELAAKLSAAGHLYKSVYAPGHGPFFEREGFLLLSNDKLLALSDDLASAEPVLAAVSEDPTLRGLFTVLNDGLDDVIGGEPPKDKLTSVLASFTDSAEAAGEGRSAPLSWQAIFLSDEDLKAAKRRLVVVQPVLDFSALYAAKEPLAFARAEGKKITAANPNLNVRFTGKIALNAEELKTVTGSMVWSGALSFVLVALVLGFGIRSRRLVFASLATLFMGLVWTAGLGLLMVGYLNMVSVAFAVLFIGLGIDFAIHFVLRFREDLNAGVGLDKALVETTVAVGAPLVLCAITTALAFFAFAPTSYAGLAQLGLIAGVGIFVSLISSVTTLPALLKLFPIRRHAPERHPHAVEEAHFIERHGRNIALAGLGVGALALLALPQVHFDFDPINLKSRKAESVAAFFDLMEGKKTSPYVIQALAPSQQQAEALADRLKAVDDVDDVVGLESYVPSNQDEKLETLETTALFMTPVFLNRGHGPPASDADDRAGIEAFRANAAELAAAYPDLELSKNASALSAVLADFTGEDAVQRRQAFAANLFTWFPALLDKIETGLDAKPITLADVPDDIRARYVATDGRWRLEVFPREKIVGPASLQKFVTAVAAAEPHATGSPVQIYTSGLVVKQAMLEASLTAAALVLLFLLTITRSFKKVGLIVLPVALAMALTAAAMWALGLAFNFANVIVLPLLIGLGVDSGIHLVWRADEEHGTTRLLFTSTPRAVILSSLTTLGSFGTLALSAHRGTASMGVLLAISIVMILVATLLVLPGLLGWLNLRRNRRKP
jgi:uncharacterized protein